MFVIPRIGTNILVEAIPDDPAPRMRELAVLEGTPPIQPNAVGDVPHKVAEGQVDFRHDFLQGDGLALETSPHAAPSLIVMMKHERIGHIADPVARLHQPLCNVHVFEPR